MARSVAVCTHLGEQLYLVAEYAVGNGFSHKSAVVVSAYAAYLLVTTVYEKSVIRVAHHFSVAVSVAHAVNFFSVHDYGGHCGVEVSVSYLPENGILYACSEVYCSVAAGFKRAFRGAFACLRAVFVVKLGLDYCVHFCGGRVLHRDGNVGAPACFADLFRTDVNSPQIDAYGSGLHKPNVPVDTAALVPPAFVMSGVDVHRDDVILVEQYKVRDIDFKRRVAAEVVVEGASVYVNRRLSAHSLEVQRDSFAFVVIVQAEMAAVPRVVVLEKAESVVLLLVKFSLDDEIMRKINFFPAVGIVLNALSVVVRIVVVIV